MNILSVENISKSYGDKPLFTDLSFGLEEGEKRALIARNGAGKSTLLKILAGIEKPDSGIISCRNGLRIGYLDQHPAFNQSHTVLQAALGVSSPVTDAIREYESCIAHPVTTPLLTRNGCNAQLRAWTIRMHGVMNQ